jgi:UDP-N-acetylmuramoyl-L-alanyl-D-glutamate--2,6-diaminopimelate ligase
MVEEGVTHMVLEVTSHGLDQNRVWGCNFKIGVLTNISHEHLDYHKTIERYRDAKLKLFGAVKYAVLNRDDDSFDYINRKCKSKCKVLPYTKTKIKEVSPALAGAYNLYNIAAAEVVCQILGVGRQVIEKAVREFRGVPGRREEVKVGQKFHVFVDFAHTPNALEQVLISLKGLKTPKAKLIVVFGCTGERDKEKRPMMGIIATKLADLVVVTSDDTRSENQDDIYQQIVAKIGMRDRDKVIKENDRRKAIKLAVKMANAGDVILLAGKGHEKSILHGVVEYPWSDVEEVNIAIKTSLADRQGIE